MSLRPASALSFLALVTSLVGFATACSDARRGVGSAQAIVGGEEVDASFAVLLRTERGRPFCTGTLVGSRWVLTAAHCVSAELAEVFVPAKEEAYTVKASTAHPKYNPSHETKAGNFFTEHDIALLELARDVPEDVEPLGPTQWATMDPSTKARPIGFGRTDEASETSMTKAARAGAYECQESSLTELQGQTGFALETPVIACTISESATCNGDSGGPLVQTIDGKIRLVGVTSGVIAGNATGRAPCALGGQDVFTSVAAHRVWLETLMVATPGGSTACQWYAGVKGDTCTTRANNAQARLRPTKLPGATWTHDYCGTARSSDGCPGACTTCAHAKGDCVLSGGSCVVKGYANQPCEPTACSL